MKRNILMLLLVALSLMVAGCSGDDGDIATDPEVPDEPVITPEENVSESDDGITEAMNYTVRLDNYLSRPSPLEINPGDTVIWHNVQDGDDRKKFILHSVDGLWEDQPINYMMKFSYTFEEPGTYNYSILGWPRMNGTVIVK